MVQSIKNNLASSNKYVVRFARDTGEIRAAQKLRFNVFNLELGEGLESAYENRYDSDKYDEQCHHLLVLKKDTEKVIGTYRMQDYEMAENGNGFYTADEFDIQSMPKDVLLRGVEVGRACIARDHRNGRVLYLLWRGLAEYLNQKNAHYLFGCCSITSQSREEAWEVLDYLKNKGLYHSSIYVEVKQKYKCPETKRDDEAWKRVKLPQLFRLYMELGAKICSPPALDKEFKTIDYLVLLDIRNLDERTRLLFFK